MDRTRQDVGFNPIPSTGSLSYASVPTEEGHRSIPLVFREGWRTTRFRIVVCLAKRDVPRLLVASRFDLRFVSRIFRDVRRCSWIPLIRFRPSKFRASLPCTVLAVHHGSRPSLRFERAATGSSMDAVGIHFA